MNSQSFGSKFFSFILKIIRIFIGVPWMLGFAAASVYMLSRFVQQLAAFVSRGVFPLPYILARLFEAASVIAFGFLPAKLVFSEKLKSLPVRKIFSVFISMILIGGVFHAIDSNATEDFEFYYYPPYIESWPSQSVSYETDCDYSQDTIYLEGSFNMVASGFRQKECIEFVISPDLTDRFCAEIMYKGSDAEIYLNQSEYYMDQYGQYTFNLNIWPLDYDYELPPQDIAYMYKHGVDLEYSEPLVVEKIIIYTAYPEKFDTSELWFQQ